MRGVVLAMCMAAMMGAVSMSVAEVDVSVSFRFGELDQYGEWVHVAHYGKVWRPYADSQWRPFYYGRWVWTSDGWLWESDEPFGWIVCHYGHWYYDDAYGWVWIPGYEWSAARVKWYVTDDEIGWMPLFPPGRAHVHVQHHWIFCPVGVFASVDLHRRVVVRSRPRTVTVYSGPPPFERIQRVTPRKIVRVSPKRVTVRSGDRPFVRVEVSGHATRRVVTPVGVKYKSVRKAPASHGGTVTVTKQGSAKKVRTAGPFGPTVRVKSGQAKSKVRIESRSEGEKSAVRVKKKKKVTVRKK